jgi:hypothetical protein
VQKFLTAKSEHEAIIFKTEGKKSVNVGLKAKIVYAETF